MKWLLLLLVIASAQGISVDRLDDHLELEVAHQIEATFEARCRLSPLDFYIPGQTYEVAISTEEVDGWVISTPDKLEVACDATQEIVQVPFNITVTPTLDAKGLRQEEIRVFATSERYEDTSGVAVVSAAWNPTFSFSVEEVPAVGVQQEVTVPVMISNDGNAMVRYRMVVEDRPERDDLVIGLPDPIVLNPGMEEPLRLTLISPLSRDVSELTLQIVGEPTTGSWNSLPQETKEFKITLKTTDAGIFAETPTPFALALVAIALARRL